jgi:ABC-type transport system substrate-binding protein
MGMNLKTPALGLWLLVILSNTGLAKSLTVSGWTAASINLSKPAVGFGNDPVLGRLACPPLTRLNLKSKKSEPLIIRKAKIIYSGLKSGARWRYELRTGIFWWNGQEFTASDLSSFIERELDQLVSNKGSGFWQLPNYKIEKNKTNVEIVWEKTPEFGPFIFNGASVWKPSAKNSEDSLEFQCVGLYEIQIARDGYSLVPTPGYRKSRPDIAVLSKSSPKSTSIRFSRADTIAGNPWARLSDKAAVCDRKILMPEFSVIIWNTETGLTSDAEIRKSLTMLTPRGAIMRSGSGYLAELTSAPIPRKHPGYHSRLQVRPYSAKMAMKVFDKRGLKRLKSDGYRKMPNGRDIVLNIVSPKNSTGLLEKILIDAYSSVGIKLHFVKKITAGKEINGVLTGISLDTPAVNFVGNFHSDASVEAPFSSLKDTVLDEVLAAYAKSVTFSSPDFSHLRKIHKIIYEKEPMTVLMQHKICVNAENKYKAKLKVAETRSPDWFKRLSL